MVKVEELQVGSIVRMGNSTFHVLALGKDVGVYANQTSVLLECLTAEPGSGWEAQIKEIGFARVQASLSEVDSVIAW